MVAGSVSPRVVSVPDRFVDYHAAQNKEEFRMWETDVFEAISDGVPALKVVQDSIEAGWNASYADWFVNFTDAQKRPIHVIPANEYLAEHSRNVDGAYRRSMWQWALAYFAIEFFIFPLILLGNLISGDTMAIAMLLFFLGRTYAGFQFFAIWAEKKGYDSTYGWWILFPGLGLFILALLPGKRQMFS